MSTEFTRTQRCLSHLHSHPLLLHLPHSGVKRTYDEEMSYVERLTPTSWRIKKGCVPNMRVSRCMCTLAHSLASNVIGYCRRARNAVTSS